MAEAEWKISGNYALSWMPDDARVVAWVRASERQSWSPLGSYAGQGLEQNQQAARSACQAHFAKTEAKRGTSKF